MDELKRIRPVWAEVNLDNLEYNMLQVKNRVDKNTMIGAVIKADGYGHGALEIADTLIKSGANYFIVATLGEALQLRKQYKQIPILILGYTPNECAEDVIKNDISQTIYNLDQAIAFNEKANDLKMKAKVHIKIDTGMSRLGFKGQDKAIDQVFEISKLKDVHLEGIYTHYAVADEGDKTFTEIQLNKFKKIIEELECRGIYIPIKHTSNSAALMDMDNTHFDMVRPGIVLYGLYPSQQVKKQLLNLKPVLNLKAKISNLKEIQKGDTVGYGRTFEAENTTKIATIPIGYADGYTRMLSGKSNVLVNGKLAPVVGAICMDQCMVDVTNVGPTQIGDEVILIGDSGENSISVDNIANILNTINYEIVCMINKRVPRVYIKNNDIIHIKSSK